VRARERHRVARKIREVCVLADPNVAKRLHVCWARDLVDSASRIDTLKSYALMCVLEDSFVLIICEAGWLMSSDDERADTVAHEIAHATKWHEDNGHGRVWKREHKRILEIAEGLDWQ
jgi:hypothetical protein